MRHSVTRRPSLTVSATHSPVALTINSSGTSTRMCTSYQRDATVMDAVLSPFHQSSGHSRGSELFLSSSTPSSGWNPSAGTNETPLKPVSTMLDGVMNSIP